MRVPEFTLQEILDIHNNLVVFAATKKDSTQRFVVKGSRTVLGHSVPLCHEKSLLSGPLLNCSGVVQLVHSWLADRWTLLVETPLGTTLANICAQQQPSATLLHTWALQAVNTLKSVHSRGVIHRDIKPSNIIEADGRIYFIDFGYSVDTLKDKPERVWVGTVEWAALGAVEECKAPSFDQGVESLCYTFWSLEIGLAKYLAVEQRPTVEALRKTSPIVAFVMAWWTSSFSPPCTEGFWVHKNFCGEKENKME
mgnify:CR=1 FL=1